MVYWGSISPLDPSYLVTATWLVTGMKHLLSTAGASLPTGRSSSQRSVSPSVRSSVRGAGGRQGTGHLIYSPHLYGALTLMAILTEHIGIYIGPPEEGKLFHKQIQEYTSSVHSPTHPTTAKTKTICDINRILTYRVSITPHLQSRLNETFEAEIRLIFLELKQWWRSGFLL